MLSKEMTLSGGGPTFIRPNMDAEAMARERLSTSQPMPRASEQARVVSPPVACDVPIFPERLLAI